MTPVRMVARGWREVAVTCALVTSALLGACGGENLFTEPSGGAGPDVRIEAPDSGQRVAVGDSVFLRVRAEDNQGIARIELAGFALTGSEIFGTLVSTPRFEPKVVDLQSVEPLVRDTVVVRYLLATGDSIPADRVVVVATATDLVGNESADTVRIAIEALPLSQPGDSATFRISLDQFGVTEPVDTATLRIETTAFAFDAGGDCATATVPETEMSVDACCAAKPCTLRVGAHDPSCSWCAAAPHTRRSPRISSPI